MYMSGIPERPFWAESLAREVLDMFKVEPQLDLEVIFYLPKTGKRKREVTGGHCYSERGLIEMMVDNCDQTQEKIFTVLHEACHIVDFQLNGRQRTKSGKRRDAHPNTFWDIAIKVYEKYFMLDYASTREYIKGRKRIKAYLEKRDEQKPTLEAERKKLRQECCYAA